MTYPSTLKSVLYSKETTWGTAVTPAKDVGIIIQDVSTPCAREVIESSGITQRDAYEITSGIVDPGVSFSGDFQHGRMLELIFGAVAHAETTGDWVHTFTIADAPPSATIEIGNNSTTDVENTIDGCLVDSAELSIELNGNLQLSVDFKGRLGVASATAAAAVTSTLPVYPHPLCAVKVNTSEATEVQSARISIACTVERSGGIGSTTYQQGWSTEIKFEYSATLGFADKTYHDIFNNDTTHEFEINGDNGTALGSGQRYVGLILENCQQTAFNELTSVGGLTFVEIAGKGTFKSCSSTDNISDTNW